MLAILILAAGASSRMQGADKLLQEVDGDPLIATMVRRAATTAGQVFVTVPDLDHARCQHLKNTPATLIPVPQATEGMGVSIATGVAALPETVSAVMILPGDMPELTAADLQTMAQAADNAPQGAILRGTDTTGRPGHPVIFPRSAFPALVKLTGDQGARNVIKTHDGPVLPVTLPEAHALTDLDTPEDWRNWRKRR